VRWLRAYVLVLLVAATRTTHVLSRAFAAVRWDSTGVSSLDLAPAVTEKLASGPFLLSRNASRRPRSNDESPDRSPDIIALLVRTVESRESRRRRSVGLSIDPASP
jgi:hypothetical protein